MTIRCSSGHENPDGSAFCDECGERLDAQSSGNVATAAPAAPDVVATGAPTPMSASGTGGQARLVLQPNGPDFDIAGKTEILLGREDSMSNIFPDIDLTPHGGEEGGVSRLHAKIYLQGGQYMIEDQNSTNATFINRQKLESKTPMPLNNGDEIRLGRVVLKFETA